MGILRPFSFVPSLYGHTNLHYPSHRPNAHIHPCHPPFAPSLLFHTRQPHHLFVPITNKNPFYNTHPICFFHQLLCMWSPSHLFASLMLINPQSIPYELTNFTYSFPTHACKDYAPITATHTHFHAHSSTSSCPLPFHTHAFCYLISTPSIHTTCMHELVPFTTHFLFHLSTPHTILQLPIIKPMFSHLLLAFSSTSIY